MRVRFIFILAFLTLGACASTPEEGIEFAAWQLPEGQPREVVQMLNGRYGQQQFGLQVRLSLKEERMQIAALDALGRRAFDILWTGKGVEATRADWISEELNAVDILKVIVAAYWPADDPMQARVADRAETLDITYQSMRANAWNEQVHIRDTELHYEMTIISYELAP